MLQLNLSSDNRVEFLPVTTGGPTFDDVLISDTPLWSGFVADYANVFGTNSFIDIAIPQNEFATITGASTVQLLFSTSANHNNINKDIPLNLSGTNSISGGLSDPVTVPEPKSGLAIGCLLALMSAGRILGSRCRRS